MNIMVIMKIRPNVVAEQGFTLIELMIALAISVVVAAGIYKAYTSQQHSYSTQEQIVEVQQNIRAAMTMLSNELRMAGYGGGGVNGTFDASCNNGGGGARKPGILPSVNSSRLNFSMDLNVDGDCADPGENLSYFIYLAANGIRTLGRLDNTNGLAVSAIAPFFDGIEFLLRDQNGVVINNAANTQNVRSVQISLLARAALPDREFKPNGQVFCPASNPLVLAIGQCTNPAPAISWAFNDSVRRRELISQIYCRNLGL